MYGVYKLYEQLSDIQQWDMADESGARGKAR